MQNKIDKLWTNKGLMTLPVHDRTVQIALWQERGQFAQLGI
jgi:hypothetical protein